MSRTRPPYPADFRQQMVELVQSGRSPEELAREFEPSAQTIRNWVVQAARDSGERKEGPTTAEAEERRRLRRENRRLREEREILANVWTATVMQAPHSDRRDKGYANVFGLLKESRL
jgi:transposase